MKWIWSKDGDKNSFVEFESAFNYNGGNAVLKISADYRYSAFIGEKMVSNGQYADLPTYKTYNQADITSYLRQGENVLRVLAWHVGQDFFVCRTMPACVAFEIVIDGKVVACSDQTTRCRKASGYSLSDIVTAQVGFGFKYDFTASPCDWDSAVIVENDFSLQERPIKQTQVSNVCTSKIVAQGVYKYSTGANPAEKMQNAWLRTLPFATMTGDWRVEHDSLDHAINFKAQDGENIFVIADMGRETCGHLSFSITVDKPCKMLLGWGEHLADLRVRTNVGGRNFGTEFYLKQGENVFDDYLFRFGGRYISVYIEAPSTTVSRLGIREISYPFNQPQKDYGDRLLNAIYEMGRRTLCLSAHEHYEDCPWREQALYGMDSRNQMLFGYGAFEEYEYPRASLMLIAKSMRDDGLISLCAPSEIAICIPSFTAYWLIAIGENAQVDFNQDFISEILPYAERALSAILKNQTEQGVSEFSEQAYWNFHEWSAGLNGGEIWRTKPLEVVKGDCIMTALTVLVTKNMAFIYEKLGNFERAKELLAKGEELKACLEQYFDKDRGVYASYIDGENKQGYHAYTQAIVLLTGTVPQERIKLICGVLKNPTEYGLVPATLAALQLKYQALIEYGNDLDYCINDIVEVFGGMLFKGATSYWETEYGEADFEDAGSLCHGWSSVACWVMDKYLK